ncbi:metallophosphoesterase family protein [Streptosporangium subroseum]|uniref:metallophosphoesterase family protein n=1 Tax=Streptosporangium subroseum TaxID=106412 RepID=UPI00308DBFB4|nr:DNA repair exonuclease [Streptosporangium subroseum]
MKLLHAADLHIDSPLRGLSSYEGAPAQELRTASRRALENLVALAISEKVTAVLLAGDIYDGDWPDFQTGLFFTRQMSQLRDADIAVYMVSGNHDAESQMTMRLRLPENVRMLDFRAPETIRDEIQGLAVHGQGFAERDITANLCLSYPDPCRDLFNVGLLHTALTGREGHALYAPCTMSDLQAKNYDYWALGHVHTREVVSQDPWIVFPGNLQGRSVRETGPKGCTVITVENLRVRSVTHHDLDVARWHHLHVDVSTATDADSALDLVRTQLMSMPGGRLRAARVSLTGNSAAHLQLWRDQPRLVNEIRSLANDLGGLWVEKVRIETRTSNAPDEGATGLLTELRRTAEALRADDDVLRRLITDTPLYSSLPGDARGQDGIRPQDPQWLSRIGNDAIDLLEAMLTEGRTR